MSRSKEILLRAFPLLLVSIFLSACTDELSVESVDNEAQSLTVIVEIHQDDVLSHDTHSSLSWSQSLSGDIDATTKFIKYFETIISQFQDQVPVSATVRVLRGDDVMHESSISSGPPKEETDILFVSGISAFVSMLSNTLNLQAKPNASKMSVLEDIWVHCCTVGGIGGYCWGYEGEESYSGFVDMDTQTYGCLCNGSGC